MHLKRRITSHANGTSCRIGNLWQFDDAMEKYGCEVYAFDPSMGKPDHKHSKKVWFYDLGIGGADSDSFVPRKDEYVRTDQIWKIRTLKSILKMIKRENMVIDFLKIDIEGNEFAVLHNILADGMLNRVKQYLVEYHVFGNMVMNMGIYAADIRKMSEMGFEPFHMLNKVPFRGKGETYRWQADMCFVNSNFITKTASSNTST
ncbi:putative methyltransferase-like protein 24 [Tubulanus polymorphus]|uniref:putative methyltransferase-like protein 24 n=1 Tax=Tubulanus polymorphus TaxID=672921 RepID=UPI003DA65C8C